MITVQIKGGYVEIARGMMTVRLPGVHRSIPVRALGQRADEIVGRMMADEAADRVRHAPTMVEIVRGAV